MSWVELQDLLPGDGSSEESRRQLLQNLALNVLGDLTTAGFRTDQQNAVGAGVLSPLSGAVPAAESTSAKPVMDVIGGALQEPVKDVNEQVLELTRQLTGLNSVQQVHLTATQENTQAVTQNTTSKGSVTGSVGSTINNLTSSFLGGLTLSPIISGLISLFGGNSSQPVPVSSPFQLPPSMQFAAGLMGGPVPEVQPIDFGQSGQVRAQSNFAPQINVHVNAMDSRSFLDHSAEIAQALREAMLSSGSLRDVMSDL